MTHSTLNNLVNDSINDLIAAHDLPCDFTETVTQCYVPIAESLAQLRRQSLANTGQATPALVIGIQGSQGSGKSTLASFLKQLLIESHQLSTVVLSIDDFYLRRSEREQLAKKVHPLFMTRGVPGTHDIALALNTIQALRQQGEHDTTPVVRFNKAIDDRAQTHDWDEVTGPVDIIILEGWCVSAPPEDEAALSTPINTLEAEEDSDGTWRRYVNAALAKEYSVLFSLFEKLIVLSAPSFDCVYEWRGLQEQKLAKQCQQHSKASSATHNHLLDKDSLQRFISHYQRITQHCLKVLPERCDWEITLDTEHRVTGVHTTASTMNDHSAPYTRAAYE